MRQNSDGSVFDIRNKVWQEKAAEMRLNFGKTSRMELFIKSKF